MVDPDPTRHMSRIFVGRQREMAELRAALDDALGGRGRIVMLAGEAGIGKTRTAQELAALAEERALATYAYEDAHAYFESGSVARDLTLTGTGEASDEEAAALLFGLARTLVARIGGNTGGAFATIRRVFEYYVEAGNVALAVATAAFSIGPPNTGSPEAGELLARALTLVPADSHEAGRILSRHGAFLGNAEGDYEGSKQDLGRAISIARREGAVPLEVQTLTYAARTVTVPSWAGPAATMQMPFVRGTVKAAGPRPCPCRRVFNHLNRTGHEGLA